MILLLDFEVFLAKILNFRAPWDPGDPPGGPPTPPPRKCCKNTFFRKIFFQQLGVFMVQSNEIPNFTVEGIY